MKSVVRAGWGVRLTHRMNREAQLMGTLDKKFSDLAAYQPAVPVAAPPSEPASTAHGEPPRLRRSLRQSSMLKSRPSEDLSYWGF